MLAGVEIPVGAAHQRLFQEDRIFGDGDDGQDVAVTDPVLGDDGLIAARQRVAAQIAGLQVRGGDGEHIPFPFRRREALPGVRGVVGRMRPVINIDGSFVVVGQGMAMEGDDALRA